VRVYVRAFAAALAKACRGVIGASDSRASRENGGNDYEKLERAKNNSDIRVNTSAPPIFV